MGRQIITEADRQHPPRPQAGPGQAPRPAPNRARGQGVSRERGTATRNKKNAGKRPHQGG